MNHPQLRRRLVAAVATGLVASLALVQPAEPPAAAAASASATTANPDSYRFLSSPDLFNADVGNMKRRPGWDHYKRQWKQRFPHRRVPNSWNRHHRRLVNHILGTYQGENPDDVFLAGDMVAGHWGFDRYYLPGNGRRVKTNAFGRTDTWKQQKRAVHRASRFYFRQVERYFSSRGMRLWPAVGDHEYGDNPWSGTKRHNRFKRAMFPVIRQRFNRHLLRPRVLEGARLSRPDGAAHRTSYATYLTPEVLLVTLDQFKRKYGRVRPKVDWKQLGWLNRTLARANRRGTDWIIVQGHLPIVPTVAKRRSSGICYQDGTSSRLWEVLRKHEVDLYFNGEVHDNSRNTVDGITQISHGGLYGLRWTTGNTAYLVGDITGDRLAITLKRFQVADSRVNPKLWQTTPKTRVVWRKKLAPVPEVIGTFEVTKDRQILSFSGALQPYDGDERCGYRNGEPHENL